MIILGSIWKFLTHLTRIPSVQVGAVEDRRHDVHLAGQVLVFLVPVGKVGERFDQRRFERVGNVLFDVELGGALLHLENLADALDGGEDVVAVRFPKCLELAQETWKQ